MRAPVQKSNPMAACPKYKTCNANVCPLHADWKNTRHLRREPICFYLLQAQKEGAEAIFRGIGREELYRQMVEITPEISARSGVIKIALAKAAKTGSRMSTKPPRSKSIVGGEK